MTITSVSLRIPAREAYLKRRPQNKISTRGASPTISYKLRNKNVIGVRSWDIANQERKICDVEIEIVTFVIYGSVKLSVSPDRPKKQKCCSLSSF